MLPFWTKKNVIKTPLTCHVLRVILCFYFIFMKSITSHSQFHLKHVIVLDYRNGGPRIFVHLGHAHVNGQIQKKKDIDLPRAVRRFTRGFWQGGCRRVQAGFGEVDVGIRFLVCRLYRSNSWIKKVIRSAGPHGGSEWVDPLTQH